MSEVNVKIVDHIFILNKCVSLQSTTLTGMALPAGGIQCARDPHHPFLLVAELDNGG